MGSDLIVAGFLGAALHAGGMLATPVVGSAWERESALVKMTVGEVAGHVFLVVRRSTCISMNPNRGSGKASAGQLRMAAVHIAADDPINDAAALRAPSSSIRTGQTVGAGHFNHLEVPDQVNAMIERFISITGHGRQGSEHRP